MMNKEINFFPAWNSKLYISNKSYKWLKDDYMLVINMWYYTRDLLPRYEGIYERRKQDFKKANLWTKKQKYKEALNTLSDIRRMYCKIRRYHSQIEHIIKLKESIEKEVKNGI